jgi:DNA-binding response OmpR family regulator
MYICILEDDLALSKEVASQLDALGHRTAIFNNGGDVIRALKIETFDLFVLDWHVPGRSGVQVLEYIRQARQLQTPILFLTSRSDEKDLISVFKLGADDYCTKPLKPREFCVRVEALLRRAYPITQLSNQRTFLNYTFDVNTQIVRFGDQFIKLSEKEFQLALILFENMDRALSRQRLFIEVWGGVTTTPTRTLDVHISWLRKKLDLSATSKTLFIKSIHGYGYRLSTL